MTDLTTLKTAAKVAHEERDPAGWFTAEDIYLIGDFDPEEAVYLELANPATVLALISQIEAVSALHAPEIVNQELTVCAHCRTLFPCRTARAAGGAA